MPIHFADAHRVRDHDPLFSRLWLRVVIQPMLWQINHDSFVGRWRQDTTDGEQDFLSLAGQPDISAGIGAHDLRISETVPARDIEHPFLVAESDTAIGSDQSRAIRRKLVDRRQSTYRRA